MDVINENFQNRSGLGETGDVYLVGADMMMLTNSAQEQGQTALKVKVDTYQTRLWHKEHIMKIGGDKVEEDKVYKNRHGREVIGVHHSLNVAGVEIVAIIEIETAEAFKASNRLRTIVITLSTVTALLIMVIAMIITRRIVKPISKLSDVAKMISKGDLEQIVKIDVNNEIGELAASFNHMQASIKESREINNLESWRKTGLAELNDCARGEMDIPVLCSNIMSCLANYMNIPIGAMYLLDNQGDLALCGSYAYTKRKSLSNTFKIGQSLVGQCALEKQRILIDCVPDDYITISSGFGETTPRSILVQPILIDDIIVGVLEVGTLEDMSEVHLDFISDATAIIAQIVRVAQSRVRTEELLENAESQANSLKVQQKELKDANVELENQTKQLQASEESLQSQQEELRASNEELEAQALKLQASEEFLQSQQEELRATNEEMEAQTRILEENRLDVERKNNQLEEAWVEIQEKAGEIEDGSRYKSGMFIYLCKWP
ncbi:MAG: HAMP domain-containing protein [Desulfobulbaceae bacterium]|nr:HAMP domain-containing protein [Desulfobulbaceae bacterium]